MLKNKDAELVAAWLREQVDAYKQKHPGAPLTKQLAEAVGTTPQAVSGWFRTGRITKTNMAHVCKFFQATPPFMQSAASQASEPQAVYKLPAARWPFSKIDAATVAALPKDDLLRLEGAILLAAAQLGISLRKQAAA